MVNKNKNMRPVAYLSMEIALLNDVKTYAGGLGVLAGDLLKSAAALHYPMVGITLLNDQGYFKQKISAGGTQIELVDKNYNLGLLTKLNVKTEVLIGEERVKLGAWQYIIKSDSGFNVPVYFLDADLSGNKAEYRKLTRRLYGGDLEYRLRQEIILGRGGVKLLNALGYEIKKYHINEGHGALAGLELFLEGGGDAKSLRATKNKCVFTTHTPIKTIYDEFSWKMLIKNQADFPLIASLIKDNKVNTLDLAMYFSGYINGVSKKHQELLNNVFPKYNIKSVTNGVNSQFWTAKNLQLIYSAYLPGWERKPSLLKRSEIIPATEIWSAHQENKKKLLAYIKKNKQERWDENTLTIGFARRFTGYKQPLLLFSDVERLLDIIENSGHVQIVIAGKAHRRDAGGQEAIKKLYQIKKQYPQLKLVFLEGYDLELAKLLVSGVDVWLNTPLPPQEACGTSGMKAAHNGVPQISTLDGWWPEGYKKNKTGWSLVGADDLYEKLKKEIIPLYYRAPGEWKEIMKNTIRLNASYFNSDRALQDYIKQAYDSE